MKYDMEFLTRREMLAIFRKASRRYRQNVSGGYHSLAEGYALTCRLVVSEWQRRGYDSHPNRVWF